MPLLLPAARALAATCSPFTATSVPFGTYTGVEVSPGSSPISLNCPILQPYQVLLNQGQSSTGTVTVRQMSNGTYRLNYGLYQDAAHILNFGNTFGAYVGGIGSGSNQSIPVYPQLTAGQNVPPGTYTDTITATLGGTASGTTTFTVTATVPPTCTISTTALAFGNYVSSSIKYGASTLSVNCTSTTPYNVGLSAGNGNPIGVPATVSTRSMQGRDSNGLRYALFRDSARTLNWGNTIGTDTVAGTGSGSTQALTVYGQVPANQNIAPANYIDTVVALITY